MGRVRLMEVALRAGGLGLHDSYAAGLPFERIPADVARAFCKTMAASGVDAIELGQVEQPRRAHPEFCMFASMEDISALIPEGERDWRRWVAMYNDIHTPPELVSDWRPGLCGTVRVVLRHSGAKELSAQRLFDIKSHSYGSIGCTIEWLRGELDTTPEKLAAWECERMPAFLLAAYDAAVREGWSI